MNELQNCGKIGTCQKSANALFIIVIWKLPKTLVCGRYPYLPRTELELFKTRLL